MENASVPDFLLSDVAAAFAFLVLFGSILLVLALASVDMKAEKLAAELRKAVRSARTANTAVELDLEAGIVEPEKKSRKKRGRRPRSSFSRILAAVWDPSASSDDSPYLLDDEVWLSPEASMAEAAQKVEAFELSDDIWQKGPFLLC
jgi:hypothetical protein